MKDMNNNEKYEELKKYTPDKKLIIGHIFQTRQNSILGEIHITAEQVLLIRVGSYILIDCVSYGIVGQITFIENSQQTDKKALNKNTYCISANIFATYDYNTGNVSAGITGAPPIFANIFSTTPEVIQSIATGQFISSDDTSDVLLNLGKLKNTNNETPISFSPNSLFGRHLAVLGTTGGGKSWTLARIFEEISKFNSKLIIFDASGEYNNLPEGTVHISIGGETTTTSSSTAAPSSKVHAVAVPYSSLLESDLYAIFKPNGRSQFPKLKQAIKSLKLAKCAPHLAIDGVILKAHRSKIDYENEYLNFVKELESTTADFNINYLTRQIENECVNPQRSPTESDIWGGLNGDDYSDCVPLINRINDIINSPNLAAIFKPEGYHSLFTVIRRFLTDDTIKILRISLQHLSFEYNAREIIANAIGRHLLEIARSYFLKSQPLLIALDEAHQFLNTNINFDNDSFPLNAFGLIAKEGRKYGVSICISTQRPRDIPEDVFSQMGTIITHRLINSKDRALIESASCFTDKTTIENLPVLPPGEAIVLGVDFPIPLKLKINATNYPPNSVSPNFQECWKIKKE